MAPTVACLAQTEKSSDISVVFIMSDDDKNKSPNRLRKLKIDGLSVDEALRHAMNAPPPTDDKPQDTDSDDDQDDTPDSDREQSRPFCRNIEMWQ